MTWPRRGYVAMWLCGVKQDIAACSVRWEVGSRVRELGRLSVELQYVRPCEPDPPPSASVHL